MEDHAMFFSHLKLDGEDAHPPIVSEGELGWKGRAVVANKILHQSREPLEYEGKQVLPVRTFDGRRDFPWLAGLDRSKQYDPDERYFLLGA